MNKESCKIALTFLDWQEQSLDIFNKYLFKGKYCITFYSQQIVKDYSLVGYLVMINIQKEDRCFRTYDEVIKFAKTL